MSGIEKAWDIYKKYIYDTSRIDLLESYNLKIAGSVPSVIWELFGAVMTEKSGVGNTGADLDGWEVKSATEGGNYEYQYHLNTGLYKLDEDCRVNHLFFNYSDGYKNVIVKAMRGSDLAPLYFDTWRPLYNSNYDRGIASEQRRQRFRKSISHMYIMQRGMSVLEIKNGIIISKDELVIPKLNQEYNEKFC